MKTRFYPEEEKVCKKNTYGRKEHLLTSKTIIENLEKKLIKTLRLCWNN